ncbi:MAG: isoaspartyl peptidase/L-asparaginase [Ignavibacteriae bacterium]|nr:MAG: isoaspartyl peptidase/L-asparaginase [Ignavibacteriota bacterium]
MSHENKMALAIHGGAGTISKKDMTPEKERAYKDGLELAVIEGWKILEEGGTALDAVIRSTVVLEDNPLFNAGKGSVFTNQGTHEMDAALMDGKTLKAGCAAGISTVKNPILLANKIMLHSRHVLLAYGGAEEFAGRMNLEFADSEYFYTEFRYKKLLEAREKGLNKNTPDKAMGTVGAAACDREGNLAAATSTGGMTNKKPGRIGDTPIIGAGTYANNNTCAVSCTGDGEYIIRAVLAYDVSCLMEYKGLTLTEACKTALKKFGDMGGDGGLIAVDKFGNIEMPFNSAGMYRSSICTGEKIKSEIF